MTLNRNYDKKSKLLDKKLNYDKLSKTMIPSWDKIYMILFI